MTNLTEYLKRYQLIAYFVLTYVFSWVLWIAFQPLVLDGQSYLMPLISLGVFAPALVGIGLSAVLKPRPSQVHSNNTEAVFNTWDRFEFRRKENLS